MNLLHYGCLAASIRRDMTGPRRPQSDGVLWPEESLTDSPARSALRPSQSSAADRPEPPGAETSCSPLRAGRLDREDRWEEAEDQQHREGDHRPDPDGRDGDLAHRCVHAGETPTPRFLFHRFLAIRMGILSGS